MPHTARIGIRIGSADPYWVQMREAVLRYAQHASVDFVPVTLDNGAPTLLEDLAAQELDALVCTFLPEPLLRRVLDHGLPVIHLTETTVRHPLLVATHGYYDIAHMAGEYLRERLSGRGQVLAVGGLLAPRGEDGRSRVAGFSAALRPWPQMQMRHVPSAWRYERAYPQIEAALREWRGPLDAIFGLSDSVALAARDAAHALGLLRGDALIIGINGDPLALSAISAGTMTATIDTPLDTFGAQVVDLACRAARRAELPTHLRYDAQLVTATNVAAIALDKLNLIAELPSRLVGVNRQQEQERLTQMEISLEINRRVGAILDRTQLACEIADLIQARYGYDAVHLWRVEADVLVNEQTSERLCRAAVNVLNQVLAGDQLIFIPNTHASQRLPPDPRWPHTRSRVVVPIHSGGDVRGLLDLHTHHYTPHTAPTLDGFQVIADQLGIALRNAELYSEAVLARAAAEKADQLKTRLLANVSHELRAPLNVILGYSQSALANPDVIEVPPALRDDLRHIYRSGEHLARLMNDLLDLSRAEIDELELFSEPINTHAFLCETFESVTRNHTPAPAVTFRLDLPEQLPTINADPVRLRQILFNLLSNAIKATSAGEIVLGAAVLPPHLRLWVADTGVGIAPDVQERIFEPFVSASHQGQRPEGVGLGLSITRRLVALHRGALRLESTPRQGSIFSVELPLPSLNGQLATLPESHAPTLIVVSDEHPLPAHIIALGERTELRVQRVASGDDLAALLATVQPVALAWDVGRAARAEWETVQRLRTLPQIAPLPLLMYGDATHNLTSVVPKPLHSSTLLDAIAAVRWPDDARPVLIADDDAPTRAMYRDLVMQALPERPLLLAENGAVAIRLLDEYTPGLVILDLMMPEVDGFAVLQQLRARPATQHTPVIVLSGKPLTFDDVQRLDHAHVTVYAKELLTHDELADSLRTRLGGDALAQPTSRLVKRAAAYIQQHYARDLSRQEIADAVGVSKNYLSQIFQQELHLSPWEYLNRYRINQARLLLRGNESITVIAAQVGFEDASYFGRVFRKQIGCSPQQYRNQSSVAN